MTRLFVSGVATAFLSAVMFAPGPAAATPSGLVKPSAKNADVHQTGWRARRRATIVDAPTTSVRSDGVRTGVDAPLTSVRTGRRGTWVRAPFVNLWVPK